MPNFRYIIDFNTNDIDTDYYNIIIIGGGLAGMYTALLIPDNYKILLITKETLEMSASILAQGGIAVPIDEDDSPSLHFEDTLYAGDGLCVEESVWTLVNEAVPNIEQLLDLGVCFDKNEVEELALTREAAHSRNRIIHISDTTGLKICETLIQRVKSSPNITVLKQEFVVDLLAEENKVQGVLTFNKLSKEYKIFMANVIVCASGGIGKVYKNTTNPEVSTGDGIAMAYRAGVALMDMEFVQFHPTGFYHPDVRGFLISEAVRGEGAILKNINDERFMPKYHELCELAPRSVVSRAIFEEMKITNSKHVFLDITFKSENELKKRFPAIFNTCIKCGINMSKDYIPVAPAAHYLMGGIKTDIKGRTSLEGFYACGEVACTGVHGANRLASNSLLEGLVFGKRIAQEISEISPQISNKRINIDYKTSRIYRDINSNELKKEVQELMTKYVGIVKDQGGLIYAYDKIKNMYEDLENIKNHNDRYFELKNILLTAKLIIEFSLERNESRGAYYRNDFPYKDDKNFKNHTIKQIRRGN